MNDLHTRDTIQLTRIHALNWYGFADSFDLVGQTVITGVYGCGKTALVDLVQTVLLGVPDHENRYNLSVGDIGGSARQIKRDLRGYVLQDLNIMEGGSRVFARQGGRSYIALEWSWPDGERRETWGIRIEYASVGADHTLDYWHVPCRIDSSDFTGPDEDGAEDVPVDAETWQDKIEALGGTRYASKDKYLLHIAAGQHLNFDSRVLKPLLLQTLRFSFGADFNSFCREHILPEDTIDIEAVRESYDSYRNFRARVQSLQEQEAELRKIQVAFNRHQELEEEIAALGYFEHTLNQKEMIDALNVARTTFEESESRHATWATKTKEIQARYDLADAEAKRLNRDLADQPNAQEFEHLKTRQHALPHEIEVLVQAVGDPAALVRDADARLGRLFTQAIALARLNNWIFEAEALPAINLSNSKLDARQIDEIAPRVEATAEKLAAVWNELTKEAESQTQKLKSQVLELRSEAARLREYGTTDTLPLREALQSRLGKANVIQIGDLCTITDPAWTDALEINFSHKLASLVPDEKIADAFTIFNNLSEINPRERLVCRADLRALSGRRESGTLAEKIHSDDPAVEQLIAHLFGSLRCCNSIAEAERHSYAILPSGAIKEPTGRRRQRSRPSEYAIGRTAREAVINAKEEQARLLAPDIANAEKRAAAAAQLRDGFKSVKDALLKLRSGVLANLRDLESKRAEQVKIQKQLSLIDNHDALEKLRKEAKLQRQAADAITDELAAHRAETPPDKERITKAFESAKVALEKAELQTLTWQRDNPESLRHAAKHRHLEEEARVQATDNRSPSATSAFLAERRRTDKAKIGAECQMLRQKLKTHPRIFDFRDFDVEDLRDNTLWDKKLSYIVDTGIKDFTKKAEDAEIEWEDRFQQNVLGQLLQRFQAIHETFRGLQRMIAGRAIGGARYSFVHTQADRNDFNQLRSLVADLDLHKTCLSGTDSAAIEQVRALRREAMKLFETPPGGSDPKQLGRQRELLDPRFYFNYDLEVTEAGRSEAISLNQRGRKGSGGETYNPYLIALMTAYMRAYRRHERSKRPSISLLLMDEAFKVNDSAAVGDCVKIISELGFQGVISCTNTVGSQVIEFFQWAMIVQKQVVPGAGANGAKHDFISNTVYAAPKNDSDVLRIIDESSDEDA